MKVVHVSTYSSGGAAIAAARLHLALREQKVDSTLLFLYKNRSEVPYSLDFRDSLSLAAQFRLKIKNKLQAAAHKKKLNAYGQPPEYFSFPETVWNIATHPAIRSADVIHFHWVAGFLDYRTLADPVFRTKKLMWTFHDINPFSGGFHYEGWFDAKPWKTISDENILLKKNYTEKLDLTCISPSGWMMRQAQNSLLGSKKHLTVHNPPSPVFAYKKRSEARMALGLPAGAVIYFVPLDDKAYRRKGAALLENALQNAGPALTFLTSGNRQLSLQNGRQIFLGVLNEAKMALCYAAADAVLFPSLEENFSNTLAEALLCGCPVFCFDTGGNSEIVNDPLYGKAVPTGDMQSLLKHASQNICNDEQRLELSIRAAYGFSIEKPTAQIINLYGG